ncbi:MAG: hypothetical protein ABEJ44_04630, partial [Halanaeroarchaeum sp.]
MGIRKGPGAWGRPEGGPTLRKAGEAGRCSANPGDASTGTSRGAASEERSERAATERSEGAAERANGEGEATERSEGASEGLNGER